MDNKKTCPQCSKLLPVTASNCKYCGASLQETKQPSIFDAFGDMGNSGKTAPLPILTPNGPVFSAQIPPVSTNASVAPTLPTLPTPPTPPTPPAPPSISPPAPPTAPVSMGTSPEGARTDEDWIPGADEPSEMFELNDIPEESELIQLDKLQDDSTEDSVVEGLPDIQDEAETPSAEESQVFDDDEIDTELPADTARSGSDDKTVVAPMSDEVLEQMTAAETSAAALFLDANSDEDAPLLAEGSELIDLDAIEDPDDDVDSILEESSSAIPVAEDEAVSGPDRLLNDNDTGDIFTDEPSSEIDPLDHLEDVDDEEETIEEFVPKSEKETVAKKVSMPPPAPGIGAPPRPVAARPSIPSLGAAGAVPQAPAPPGSVPVAPRTPSISPPSLATPVVSTSVSVAASVAATPSVVPKISSQPEQVAPVALTPAPSDPEVLPPVAMDAPISENTARIDAEDFQRTRPPETEVETDMEEGASTKKVVIISVAAFAVTLAVALGIMFAMHEPNKIEVVDSSALEPKPVSMNPEPAKTSSAEKSTAPTQEVAPKEIEATSPIAANCLPLSRYYKKFPWKSQLEKILEAQGATKVCELFGTPPSVVAAAFENATVVGPTGYDWIVNGGRVEIYPQGTIGAREPSIEFLYANGKLFKMKLKYRNLKMGRFADAETLQKIFKKEDTQTDHLGRKATMFDEQDMRVVLIEEEWYGQTLRTLEFSSVKQNEELSGHLQKLQSLETVYKAAESAYFGWKFDDALKKYEEVNSMAPGIGAALVKRGLIYLRNDDFGNARKLAEDALENSAEDDVKAEAKGILAVNAMRNGNPDEAVSLLQEALSLSPANDRFKGYIDQLQSGEYTTSNIAQTAARLECIKDGKSEASELGVLARGFFPDQKVYQKNAKRVAKEKEFKETKKNLMAWECK